MKYSSLDAQSVRRFCEDLFVKWGFPRHDSAGIADVLVTADLFGIESHGVQRLIRYYLAFEEGSIDPGAQQRVVHDTPLSAVIDAPRTMGQVVGRNAMELAIKKARESGAGIVTVRGSNHYGIAGYYTLMAAKADMLGISMTNTEAIMVPTFGKKAMLGTSPIAVCMPADPVPFWYDAATTVVTRGKLEVYNKRGASLPPGWASDEDGLACVDPARILGNIVGKKGGGIFPLGGSDEETGSHKGYGLGVIVELFTALFSGGTTSPHVMGSGNADTSFCFWAIDYGLFGDKNEIRGRVSALLQELRDSPKADGQTRIYTHGEKEFESRSEKIKSGIPVNEKTLSEMRMISERAGIGFDAYFG
ncbi:MAG: Ldh family oxidoreductase [Clostridiales bacterium]|nr:Ldh family oxidoreductase [Clostridiales bacterium]